MKKFFFVAVAAAVVFASCQKAEQVNLNANQDEVSIIAFNKNMTKGYTGWASGQTSFEEIEQSALYSESPTKADRAMQLSAYNNNTKAEFFCDECFQKGTDGYWHATTPIYYPLGDADNIEFLAYSTSKDVATAGKWEGPKKVVFEVGSDFFQTDILYAAATSATKDDKKAVSMKFDHAQAWINMNLCFTKSTAVAVADNFKIKSIVWNEVKPEGKLTIESEAGAATATWNFFGFEKNSVEMAGAKDLQLTCAAAETPAVNEYKHLDMLLPAQNAAAKSFTINYTLGEKDYEYEFIPDTTKGQTAFAKWVKGSKYTYNIKIEILEVTINPTVEVFVQETAVDYSL